MRRWWLGRLQRFLQSVLSWISETQNESPRQSQRSVFSREIHVPTPLVTVGVGGVLFVLLLPAVGITLPHILALATFVALLSLFFVIYFCFDLPQFINDDEAVFLTGLCIILGVLFIEIGASISPQVAILAVPVGAIAIIITLLLHIRLAFLMSMVLALFAGVLNRFSFDATAIALFSSCAALLAAHRVRTRGDIMRAGFHVAWVTFLVIYGLGFFHGWSHHDMLFSARWALVNGALCATLPLAMLPMLESFFSRITAVTLLEVGDFNRPILRRLMLEAPGTYHHTLLVAALAEQAAEAIGANSLLCRVGMYYHDIGKLAHPEYFIENQTMRRSPKDKAEHHDKLNPSISSLVIMSHVKDGLALARSHKVPEEVMRFIPEHHGTSLIKYFYMRALEQDDEQVPPEQTYRYPGPRPHSKETVIGMLADSVEAASRAMEDPTYDRLRDLVAQIVNSKVMDEQFDEAPITLQDLRKIIDSFTNSLSAIYHVRIEYPPALETDPSQNLLRPASPPL